MILCACQIRESPSGLMRPVLGCIMKFPVISARFEPCRQTPLWNVVHNGVAKDGWWGRIDDPDSVSLTPVISSLSHNRVYANYCLWMWCMSWLPHNGVKVKDAYEISGPSWQFDISQQIDLLCVADVAPNPSLITQTCVNISYCGVM